MSTLSSDLKHLSVFYQAIKAMIYRELQSKFGVSKYGWAITIFEPILHISFYLILFAIIKTINISNINSVYFLAIAIINNSIFMNVFLSSTNIIISNKPLFAFAQIKPFTMIIAKSILELYLITISAILIWGISLKFSPLYLPNTPYLAVTIIFSTWILSIGLALIFSIICAYFIWFQTIIRFVNRVIYISSGIFFTTQFFSETTVKYLYINPLLISNEALRKCFFPYYSVEPPLNYLFLASLLIFFLGLILNFIYGKRVIGLGI